MPSLTNNAPVVRSEAANDEQAMCVPCGLKDALEDAIDQPKVLALNDSSEVDRPMTAKVNSGAKLVCKCGEVSVTMASNSPMASCECCCIDCNRRLSIYEKRGGKAAPDCVKNKEQPVLLHYYIDKFNHIKGKSNLIVERLKSDASLGGCDILVAGCCNTMLCLKHDLYQNAISLYPQVIQPLGVVDAPDKPSLRLFPQDWPQKNLEKLDKSVPLFYIGADGQVAGSSEPDFQEPCNALFSSFATEKPDGPGVDFHDLKKACGGEVTLLDDE